MERKNQNILVVLTAIVIAVAVFSSFGMNLVPPHTASISLTTPTPAATPGQSAAAGGEVRDRVAVTPETVQAVVATLSRPESYYRRVSVSYAGVEEPTVSQMWVSGGWTRTDTTSPNGTIRHTLVGEGTIYIWYNDSRVWSSAPADKKSADLEGAHIPTYEDVLELDGAMITDASYPAECGGMSCIYVEWSVEAGGEWGCYYISVEPDSVGLLAGAERYEGEELLLSARADSDNPAAASGSTFLLPDGSDPRA